MKKEDRRAKKDSFSEKLKKFFQKYVELETLIILSLFFYINYLYNPKDICLIHHNIPFLIILLSLLVLFHGFRSGFLSILMLFVVMWQFYKKFPYVDYLVDVIFVLIFGQFHYFWTKKIHELKIGDDYKAKKLNELSRAFYSLKISHDQLEKNYILKPMSIRSAIEQILISSRDEKKLDEVSKQRQKYEKFLSLLEKSFHLQSGALIFKDMDAIDEDLDKKNSLVIYTKSFEKRDLDVLLNDVLVTEALDRKKPVFISDETKNPTLLQQDQSFIAVIPGLYDNQILSILIVEKMPFMAFNKENLTSITILLEYLSIEIYKQNFLNIFDKLNFIEDADFRYEFNKLYNLNNKYRVNSTIMIIKIKNELQAIKVYEKIKKLLRSLDMVIKQNIKECHYIFILFPINDKAASLGFLNRLLYNLEKKYSEFEYMNFSIKQTSLMEEYIKEGCDE